MLRSDGGAVSFARQSRAKCAMLKKTDRGTYDAAEGVFTPADGQEADQEYIDYVCALVRSKFSYCTQVQNTHYFRWLAQYLEEENE